MNIKISSSPNLPRIYILYASALFVKQWNFRNMESRIAKQCSFTLYIGGTHPLDCIIIHQTLHRDNDNVINSTLLERNNCLDWLITYERMQLPPKHSFKVWTFYCNRDIGYKSEFYFFIIFLNKLELNKKILFSIHFYSIFWVRLQNYVPH